MTREDASMKTKPKHRLRARRQPRPPIDHGQQFEAALRAVEREDEVRDYLANPQPCCLCNAATMSTATRLEHRTDGSVRLEMFHLCGQCQDNSGVERLNAILDREQ